MILKENLLKENFNLIKINNFNLFYFLISYKYVYNKYDVIFFKISNCIYLK